MITKQCALWCGRVELISCDRHLSIQSALLSVSPVKLQGLGADIAVEVKAASHDEMQVVAIDTENGEDDELSDAESDVIPDCNECDERERLALVDSPPVLVQTGEQLFSLLLSVWGNYGHTYRDNVITFPGDFNMLSCDLIAIIADLCTCYVSC